MLRPFNKKGKWIFKHTPFGNEDLTIEHINSMGQEEYNKLPKVSGNMLLVKEQVMKDYVNPLMTLLRKQKNETCR
jgi:hypothetical protein